MAFDEINVKFNPDHMGMDAIGPDMAKVFKEQFNAAWGVTPTVKMDMQGPQMDSGIEMQMAAPAIDPKDPNNLWGNNDVQRNPVLDGVEGASYNVQANTKAMSDGAPYAVEAACNQMGELVGGVFDLLNPAKDQGMDMAMPDPRMAPMMGMQMRPGGGLL